MHVCAGSCMLFCPAGYSFQIGLVQVLWKHSGKVCKDPFACGGPPEKLHWSSCNKAINLDQLTYTLLAQAVFKFEARVKIPTQFIYIGSVSPRLKLVRSVEALQRDLVQLEQCYNECSELLAQGEAKDFDQKCLGKMKNCRQTSIMFFWGDLALPMHLFGFWPSHVLANLSVPQSYLRWTQDSEKMMKDATLKCLESRFNCHRPFKEPPYQTAN